MRAGVGMVEILVGLAILSMGLLPAFDLMQTSRHELALSQEMLMLQAHSVEVMAEANEDLLRGTGPAPGESRELQRDGAEATLSVTQQPGDGLLILHVEVRSAARVYRVYQAAADPYASFRGERP